MSTESSTTPAAKNETLIIARGLAGAAAGGVLGYIAFYLLVKQGFYSILVPAVCLGLAAGWAARGKSQLLGILCGALAGGLMVFTEWHVMYAKNHSFPEFLAIFHTLQPVKFLMMALGVAFAYWFGRGR